MKKCLVVVDMQNDFVTGALGSGQAQLLLKPMKSFIDSFDGTVVYTQDTHHEDYMETQEGKRLPVVHCVENRPGWDIVPELGGNVNKQIFKKPTFGSLVLGGFLKDNAFDEVHFVGVCTGICVISNAVIAKANLPQARIVIHADLCACVSDESHETALAAMSLLQMDIEGRR